MLAPMLKVPKTVPSRAYAQVVPLWRYIENVWVPVLTEVVPPPTMLMLLRLQILVERDRRVVGAQVVANLSPHAVREIVCHPEG